MYLFLKLHSVQSACHMPKFVNWTQMPFHASFKPNTTEHFPDCCWPCRICLMAHKNLTDGWTDTKTSSLHGTIWEKNCIYSGGRFRFYSKNLGHFLEFSKKHLRIWKLTIHHWKMLSNFYQKRKKDF